MAPPPKSPLTARSNTNSSGGGFLSRQASTGGGNGFTSPAPTSPPQRGKVYLAMLLAVIAVLIVLGMQTEYIPKPKNLVGSLTGASKGKRKLFMNIPADWNAKKWADPLKKPFSYQEAVRNLTVLPTEINPDFQVPPSDGSWKPIKPCVEVNGICFYFRYGIFTPPIDAAKIRQEAQRVVDNGLPDGMCSLKELRQWVNFKWRAEETPGFVEMVGKKCQLPDGTRDGMLTSWMAGALRSGYSHPVVIVRGESLHRNVYSRFTSIFRGFKQHIDHNFKKYGSYILTNYRDIFTLPVWRNGDDRPLPSKVLQLDAGEVILFELLYIASRGEGNDIAYESLNASLPLDYPITGVLLGTTKWDYYRQQFNWKLNDPLPPWRHAPFYEHMNDLEHVLHRGSALFYLSGHQWFNPTYPRFYNRMRLRNEAFRTAGVKARVLRNTRGAVGYIDYNYLIRLSHKKPETTILPADMSGHFSCILRYLATVSGKDTVVARQPHKSKPFCPDNMNRAGVQYMAAFVRALAAEHKQDAPLEPLAHNHTALSWLIATTLFVDKNYTASGLCRWAPALERLSDRTTLTANYTQWIIDQADKYKRVDKGNATSEGKARSSSQVLVCRSRVDDTHRCSPVLQRALDEDKPDYCQHTSPAATHPLCPGSVSVAKLDCPLLESLAPTATAAPATVADDPDCIPAKPDEANGVINRICHFAAEQYKRQLFDFLRVWDELPPKQPSVPISI